MLISEVESSPLPLTSSMSVGRVYKTLALGLYRYRSGPGASSVPKARDSREGYSRTVSRGLESPGDAVGSSKSSSI